MTVNDEQVRALVRDYRLDLPGLPGSRVAIRPHGAEYVTIDASTNNLGGDDTADVLAYNAARFLVYRGKRYTGRITLRRGADGTWSPHGDNNMISKGRSARYYDPAPSSYAAVMLAALVAAGSAWATAHGDALAASEYVHAADGYARAQRVTAEAANVHEAARAAQAEAADALAAAVEVLAREDA